MTNKTRSAIDHIITKAISSNNFNTVVIRIDIPDHLPIIYTFKLKTSMSLENHLKDRYLFKRIINESSKTTLKRRHSKTS